MNVPDPSVSFARIAERLAGLGARAVLMGAMAALRYRRTHRATTDIDVLVDSLDGVAEAFEADGYEVRVATDEHGRPYALFARAGDRRIDLLLAETDYQRTAMERATDGVLTPEDVIVHKLIAWRARDIDDIVDILAAGVGLDTGYIERWARIWEVSDRWRQALLLAGP